MELTPLEARVLGSLMEKQLATPQYYPLTLNALTLACNQSSNRDPVSSYGETEVADGLASLRDKGLARVVHSPSNRAAKYRHVLDEVWGLDAAHRAVLAVLLLRGPQTLGELRLRTERLAGFSSLAEVEEVARLLGDRDEPLARMLERLPGQKEARVAHLLGGSPAVDGVVERASTGVDGPAHHCPAPSSDEGLARRVIALEAKLAELEAAVERLSGGFAG